MSHRTSSAIVESEFPQSDNRGVFHVGGARPCDDESESVSRRLLPACFGEIVRNALDRVHGPSAFLGAHVGSGVHRGAMRFLQGLADEQLAGEGSGEGVACANGIGDFDVRRQQWRPHRSWR